MERRKRILIVDDHPVNVLILRELFKRDYELATAASGERALAVAEEFRPHLILLDVMMPGIDGYETCRRLRATPELKDIKVIMVTAKAMPAEREEGFRAGADDYVTKPFAHQELRAKVQALLESSP